MKVNSKVKVFCYVCMNVGVAIWSRMVLLAVRFLQKGDFRFPGSLVMVNALLWVAFGRARTVNCQ